MTTVAASELNDHPQGSGVWSPAYRSLTVGLVLTITLTAVESLAVITILPLVKNDLGGLNLYGWVTSAFFLGTLIGVVVGGRETDARGPAPVYLAGLGLFATGLILGGAAPSMAVLVLARAIQGLGAGAIPTISYAIVGRTYPERLRPRIFAVLSTAWVVPGLAGPGASALIAERFGWRVVFWGIIPLIAVAVALCLPSLRRIGRPEQTGETPHGVVDAVRVSVAAALVLGGLQSRSFLITPILLTAGIVVGGGPLRRLMPAGTIRAAAGLPATVLMRGLLSFSFLGADTFVPLAITSARGQSATFASIAVTAATVAWTAGSWAQERLAARQSARTLVTCGMAIIVLGIAGEAASLNVDVPVWETVAAWGLGGFGIGLAYPILSVLALRGAPLGTEGRATASVQLADNLGIAMGSGVGGVAVAIGVAAGGGTAIGLAATFALTGVAAFLGLVTARRLPRSVVPRE
jgi:MFS family permease